MPYDSTKPNTAQGYADLLASIRENFRAIVDGDTPWTVPKGGTGLTSIPANSILYGNGTSAISTSTSLTYNGTTLSVLGTPTANIFKVAATGGGDAVLMTAFTAGNGGIIGALDAALADYTPFSISGNGVFIDLRTSLGNKSNFAKFSNNISTWTAEAAGLELYGPTNHAVLRLAGPSGADLFVTSSTAASYLSATTNVPIIFCTNNAEQMRLTTTGLGIGSSTISAKIHSHVADGTYSLGLSGTTKGIRFEHSSATSSITGVDNSLSATYQPLQLMASELRFAISGTEYARMTASGLIFGGTTPSALFHAIGTTEQLRLGHDASNYVGFTIASNGDITLRQYATAPTLNGVFSFVSLGDYVLVQGVKLYSGDIPRIYLAPCGYTSFAGIATLTYANLNGSFTPSFSTKIPSTNLSPHVGIGAFLVASDDSVYYMFSSIFDTDKIAFLHGAGDGSGTVFNSVYAQDTTNGHFAITIPDADLGDADFLAKVRARSNANNGAVAFSLDESGNTLKFRVLYSDGSTYKTGSIALA